MLEQKPDGADSKPSLGPGKRNKGWEEIFLSYQRGIFSTSHQTRAGTWSTCCLKELCTQSHQLPFYYELYMPFSSWENSSAAKTMQMHQVNIWSCELNKSSLLPQSIAYNTVFKVFLHEHFGWIPGPTKDSGSFALRFSGMHFFFCV